MVVTDVLVSHLYLVFVAWSFHNNLRATEMDVTIIGLQNAGKTSLLRVLSVGQTSQCSTAGRTNPKQGAEFTIEYIAIFVYLCSLSTNIAISSIPTVGFNMKRVQKGHVSLKWWAFFYHRCIARLTEEVGI